MRPLLVNILDKPSLVFLIIVHYSLDIVIAIINSDYFEQIYAIV